MFNVINTNVCRWEDSLANSIQVYIITTYFPDIHLNNNLAFTSWSFKNSLVSTIQATGPAHSNMCDMTLP